MPYSITPFNITASAFIGLALYSFATAPSGGDGLSNFWVIPMITLALIFAGIDYYAQVHISNYMYLCIGEATVVIGLFILAYFNGFINF